MATGAIIARIVSQYSGKGVSTAKRDLVSLSGGFDKMAKRAVKSFAIVGVAAGAMAIKIGFDAIKMAAAEEDARVLLANAIRNTTSATEADIVATNQWIESTQLATGVLDSDLRPALSKLLGITNDIKSAQVLLGIAMDTSAGSGRDLSTVTTGLMRASTGNLAGMSRLGIILPENVRKSKDFGKALEYLAARYSGAASEKANTFGMKIARMGIAFDEAKESLGYALMPILTKYFNMLVAAVPLVQKWIDQHGKQIVKAFEAAITVTVKFAIVAYNVVSFFVNNTGKIAAFGSVLAGIWAAGKMIAFIMVLEKVIKAWKVLRAAAIGAAAATAMATGGISVAAAAAGMASFALVAGGAYLTSKKLLEGLDKVGTGAGGLKLDMGKLTTTAADFNKMLKNLKINLGGTSTETTKLTKQQQALLDAQKRLKAFGLTIDKNTSIADLNPVQIEAVRLNLLKQQGLEKRAANLALVEELNIRIQVTTATQRYADILRALADNTISTTEVSVLAAKWGMTTGAVVEYIGRVYAASSTPVSDEAIIQLYMSWGMTREAAKKYIDFAKALGDEKLSDKEIAGLQTRWGLTHKEVLEYAKTVQAGTVFSTTWADDGNAAKGGWDAALIAFNAYQTALSKPVTLPPVITSPGLGGKRAHEDNWGVTGVVPAPFMGAIQGPGLGGRDAGSIFNGPINSSDYAGRNAGVAGMTVNVYPQGSVVTQGDLVSGIRDGLLAGQSSGRRITMGSDF